MKHTPRLVVISAPSGAGKTTLCARLLKEIPELTLSISTTTRAPRGQEKDGVEYHFSDAGRFEDMIARGLFAEWAKVHDNYYGTSKALIESAFANGKSVLLDIDVQGAAQLRKSFPDRSTLVFISPPDMETLESRLRARGTESEEIIQKRLQNSRQEMKESEKFDRVIVNDDLERAYRELASFVGKAIGVRS